MTAELPRRVLLVAGDELRPALASGWEAVPAGGVEQACFIQDAHPCDAAVTTALPAEALAALARRVEAPLVLVCEPDCQAVLDGIRHGGLWLPADVVRRQPSVLTATLEQAALLGEERRRAAAAAARLRDTRARVDRLLGLLWEVSPASGLAPWFSQRYMLERLDEEVARAQRHGVPLSLVLGELRPAEGGRFDLEHAGQLAAWAARQIGACKRRYDVAGQYGLSGFMLLLPQAEREAALGTCRRLGEVLSDPAHDGLPAAHAHFGVATVPGDQATVLGLLRRAEERLQAEEQDPG